MHFRQVVDGHCDTITALTSQKRGLGEYSTKGQLDLPRMLLGGVNVQFFAIFISPAQKDMALKRCLQLVDAFFLELEKNKDTLELALDAVDIERITEIGRAHV